MREGWKVSTLGRACQIKPPKKEARERLSANDMVSFVPMNDLGVGEKGLKGAVDRTLVSVSGSYTYFADGDVLLAKITPCFENGKLGIARGLTNGVGFGSSEFIVFRPDDSLNAEFLFYFLSQDSFRNEGASVMSGAVGHKRVPKEFVERCPIPLPPLPEQKRIVAILDEAFTGIATAVANTEKNLANARELFESYLNGVFSRRGEGWTKCMLAEVCDFENGDRGKNYPNKSVLVACGRPFVNAGHLSEGRVCVDRMSYIPEDRYQLLGNGKFSPGDILFCLRGSLGKFGMVGPNVGNGAIASSLVIIRPKSHGNRATVRREFLLHYFRSNLCSEMIKKFSGGAAQPNLGARDLAKFEIHCPSIEEQQSISSRLDDYLEDTRRLDQVMRLKLMALGELKQSLLQKAFSGELTAAPQDEVETALA